MKSDAAILLVAGSLSGTTQTLPLAIFAALESDVRLAVVFSLVLAAMGCGLLLPGSSFPHLPPDFVDRLRPFAWRPTD